MDFVNRYEIERKLARVLSKDLRVELDKLLNYLGDPPNLANVPPEYWQGGWKDIQKDVEPVLVDALLQQADDAMIRIGIGVDFDNVNRAAVNWARQHSEEVMQQIWLRTHEYTLDVLSRYSGVGEVIAQGYEEGLTIREISERLERMFSPVRAERIAVTETTRAVVEGERIYVEELERETGQRMIPIWMTANDELVCPICAPRNEKPITDGMYPPAHPNCLPGDTLVLPGGNVSAGSKRWYEGNIVTIETLENKLTATPNHPILTDRGWVGAGDIVEGDHVFGYSSRDWKITLIDINDENRIPTIENIFSSLGVNGFRVPVSAPDFHNDGAGSDIAIIRPNSKIMNYGNANFFEPVTKNELIMGNIISQVSLPLLSSHAELIKGNLSSSGSIMSGGNLLFSLACGHSFPLDSFGLGLSSGFDASIKKLSSERASAYIKLFSKCVFGLPFDVSLQEVVNVRNDVFSGHVYNLQTESGVYIANGIITHNCRCGVGWEFPKDGAL